MRHPIPESVSSMLKQIIDLKNPGTFIAPWYIRGSQGVAYPRQGFSLIHCPPQITPHAQIRYFAKRQDVWGAAIIDAVTEVANEFGVKSITHSGTRDSRVGTKAVTMIKDPSWWISPKQVNLDCLHDIVTELRLQEIQSGVYVDPLKLRPFYPL